MLDVTRSTNSDAMALGREGAAEGTVVIAEEQTAGRGRLGRTWESSRGVNLYMSMLLRPAIAPWRAPQLSLVAGVAVAETVREEGIDAAHQVAERRRHDRGRLVEADTAGSCRCASSPAS